jgi:serine protease Do
VNLKGEVIGINTMILTGGPLSQGNIGIGFAIASNVARNVFPDLVKNGRISRGYLGVLVTDLDEARAHALKLEPNTGVFVSDVPDPNSPAGKAGLQPKDVITAFNGKPVKAGEQLTDAVASTPVGQQARVDFIRQGQAQSVTVELAERPVGVSARAIPRGHGDEEPDAVPQSRLGIQARTLTPDEATKLKLKRPTGVFVSAVAPNSPAADAGLLHGDVIHSLDGADLSTVEELSQAVKSLKPGAYLVEIERSGRTVFLTVTIE